MPSYTLRDIPPDIWKRFSDRAHLERWPLRALVLQLLDDFGSTRINPSTPPPVVIPEYAWLRPHFRRIAKQPDFATCDVAERWKRLSISVATTEESKRAALSKIVGRAQEEILAWLESTTKKELPQPNRLTMRVIATFGTGPDLRAPDRRPLQYEVMGLPPGQQAWIAEFNRKWRIMRVVNGVQREWSGSYDTAEDALRELEVDIEHGS